MKFLTPLFLIFLSVSVMAQKPKLGKNEIEWRSTYKLVWGDFKAGVPSKHEFSALSNIGFKFSVNQPNLTSLNVYLLTIFNRDNSWVKRTHKSGNLLNHEQKHFDLYEVWMRKCRKEIIETITLKNAKDKLESLVTKYHKLALKDQTKYDNQSKHSINTEKQAEWDKKISEELEEYKDYASSSVLIR